jgi:large subunit ribosomal protein L23
MERYYKVIKKPLITEKTFDLIERENKLVLIVDKSANKSQIKRAIEKIYDVKTVKINTLITPRGQKKAFIKLHPDYSAQDIAIDLGIF